MAKQERPPAYFEGVLQLRNTTPDIYQWVIQKVKADGKARIAKEKKVPNGIDLYFSEQHYMQSLGKKMKETFPGQVVTSRRLFTTDKMTSKFLYRVTVLFKGMPFKRGDIVEFQGEKVQILNVANRIQVKNIKSGIKQEIPALLLKRARPVSADTQ